MLHVTRVACCQEPAGASGQRTAHTNCCCKIPVVGGVKGPLTSHVVRTAAAVSVLCFVRLLLLVSRSPTRPTVRSRLVKFHAHRPPPSTRPPPPSVRPLPAVSFLSLPSPFFSFFPSPLFLFSFLSFSLFLPLFFFFRSFAFVFSLSVVLFCSSPLDFFRPVFCLCFCLYMYRRYVRFFRCRCCFSLWSLFL